MDGPLPTASSTSEGTTASSTGAPGNAAGRPASAPKNSEGVDGQNPAGANREATRNPSSVQGTPEATEDPNIFTLKVHGSEQRFDIRKPEDLKVIRLAAQKSLGADKRLNEASEKEKKAQLIFEAMKKDPVRVMQLLGHDPYKISQGLIAQKLQYEQMSPDQRELFEAKQRLAQYQRDEDDRKTQESVRVQNELQDKYRVHYDKEISKALEGSGLPKNDFVVQRTAAYLLAAKKMGYRDVSASDVIENVRRDYIQDFKAFMGASSIDQIEQIAGKDWLKKVRELDIARLNKPQAEFIKKPDAKMMTRPEKKRALTSAEWRADLERRVKS